jgi:hypothetical protein
MFGLESHEKKKKPEEFVFELEKELKDPKKHQEILQRVETRIQKIKEALRTGSGGDQEEFDRFGLLLQGYQSLLKIMARSKAKSK